jgi:hypothetical protein
MNWAIRFSLICFGAIVVVFLAVWALSGFSHFGLDADDFMFLGLGSLFTILLAIALMAAMFAGERKGGIGPK